jgi:hypothetical protein
MKVSRVEFTIAVPSQAEDGDSTVSEGTFICPDALDPVAYLKQVLTPDQNKNLTVQKVLLEELPPHPDAMGQDIHRGLSRKNHWLKVVTIRAED